MNLARQSEIVRRSIPNADVRTDQSDDQLRVYLPGFFGGIRQLDPKSYQVLIFIAERSDLSPPDPSPPVFEQTRVDEEGAALVRQAS